MNTEPFVCSLLPSTTVTYRVDLYVIDPLWLDGREPAWVTLHTATALESARTVAEVWLVDRPELFSEARIVEVREVVTNTTVATLAPSGVQHG